MNDSRGPQRLDESESLIEPTASLSKGLVLSEAGVFLGYGPESCSEDTTTAREQIDRGHLLCQQSRSAPRNRSHEHSDPHPARHSRDRGKDTPRFHGASPRFVVEEVIPDEEAIPTGCFGGTGEINQQARIGEVTHIRDTQPKVHACIQSACPCQVSDEALPPMKPAGADHRRAWVPPTA
jgi:hypothetical protein